MPKCTQEAINKKKNEIIDACAKLYETTSFRDVSIKEIGKLTSFTRTAIYNYFSTKEEIFLEILIRDLDSWSDALNDIKGEGVGLTLDEAADGLAASLATRVRMLGLLSMNLAEIQDNCREDNLHEFEAVYSRTLDALKGVLKRLAPDIKEEETGAFICAFYPFLYGIYPYFAANIKREEGDTKVCVPCQCKCVKIFDLVGNFTRILLEDICCEYLRCDNK